MQFAKGDTMSTNKELEQKVSSLENKVGQLATTNSQVLDDIAALKNNYTKLVEDVGVRLKVVHEKLFRE
jgi:hypothetical protein